MKLTSVMALACAFGLSLSSVASPLRLVLRLQERVPMQTLAKNVTDPSSSRYRKFYTPEEIREVAGPLDADYNALLKNLQASGVTIVEESPTHLFVTVDAEESVVEKVFQVSMQHPTHSTHSFTGTVQIPSALKQIASVTGLDNQRHSTPRFKRPAAGATSIGVSLATIRTVYGFDAIYSAGVTGAVDFAIATYDDFDASDVTTYYTEQSLSPMPTVDKVAVNGTPAENDNSAMETCTDAELSGALAPGAKIHVFSSATNDDTGELKLFTAILDDNRAKVANYSWGGCENTLTAQHKSDMAAVFDRAIAQGVNIMIATGDSGSACPTEDSSGNVTGYTDPMADWPAAHNEVVAVGGATLDTSSTTTLSETAWTGNGAAGGSGGGISTLWSLPTWQSALGSPYTMRSYPDVAFNADPNSGQEVIVTEFGIPFPTIIGGTSIAAPQWSAFMLLVGEARATANLPTLGYLNPILYAMSATDKANCLDDITSGNNGKYTAGAGWDAVTGWGGLHASNFLNYLKAN